MFPLCESRMNLLILSNTHTSCNFPLLADISNPNVVCPSVTSISNNPPRTKLYKFYWLHESRIVPINRVFPLSKLLVTFSRMELHSSFRMFFTEWKRAAPPRNWTTNPCPQQHRFHCTDVAWHWECLRSTSAERKQDKEKACLPPPPAHSRRTHGTQM